MFDCVYFNTFVLQGKRSVNGVLMEVFGVLRWFRCLIVFILTPLSCRASGPFCRARRSVNMEGVLRWFRCLIVFILTPLSCRASGL